MRLLLNLSISRRKHCIITKKPPQKFGRGDFNRDNIFLIIARIDCKYGTVLQAKEKKCSEKVRWFPLMSKKKNETYLKME